MSDVMTSPTRIGRLRWSFSTVEAIGSVVLWIILTILTQGLALIVFPYYLNRVVLNKTELLNASGRVIGRLNCTLNIGHSIGHVIVWVILILVTLDVAGFSMSIASSASF